MNFPKDDPALEQLRSILRRDTPEVQETDRAEADLLAVSFKSVTYPERQVWVHTYNQVNKIIIDLEDWNTDIEWDHSIAHKATSSVTEAVEIIKSWLSGKDSQ